MGLGFKKHLYFYLNVNDFPDYNKYRLANPLIDDEIQQEIINWAIGWEYWFNVRKGFPVKWGNDEMIQEIFRIITYDSTFPFPEDYPLKNCQRASWALALLGKRIRGLAKQEGL